MEISNVDLRDREIIQNSYILAISNVTKVNIKHLKCVYISAVSIVIIIINLHIASTIPHCTENYSCPMRYAQDKTLQSACAQCICNISDNRFHAE